MEEELEEAKADVTRLENKSTELTAAKLKLQLYNNQLSGPIPPELGSLADLNTRNHASVACAAHFGIRCQ